MGDEAKGSKNLGGVSRTQQKQANRKLKQGNLEHAQKAACLAVHYGQDSASALTLLAQVLLLRRDGATSAIYAERAVKLEPESRRANSILVDALARGPKHDRARDLLLTQVHIPNDEPGRDQKLLQHYLERGETALKRRDYALSERSFRRALLIDKTNILSAAGLSNSLTELGDKDAALRWADYTIALDRKSPLGPLALGDAWEKAGERAKAAEAWRAAQKLAPDSPAVRNRLEKLANQDD
jgi:tetratricopeptide (TPR) repeat protein